MQINKQTITLQTERLILRPFEESDFEAVHSYASNYENIKHMTFGPNKEEHTKEFIKNAINKANTVPQTEYEFAITLRENEKLIGACGLHTNKELTEGNLGWVLHMDYWKKGFGTEFAHELLRFGFEELNLHRIYATCDADNYGSYRVMERNGMRREGYFKQCRPGRKCDPDKWYDDLHYAILKEEWENGKQQGN